MQFFVYERLRQVCLLMRLPSLRSEVPGPSTLLSLSLHGRLVQPARACVTAPGLDRLLTSLHKGEQAAGPHAAAVRPRQLHAGVPAVPTDSHRRGPTHAQPPLCRRCRGAGR